MVTVLQRAAKPGRKPKAAVTGAGTPDGSQLSAQPGSIPGVGGSTPLPAAAAPMMKVPDQWPFPPSADPLDALVAAGPERVAQLMLWKQRIQNPELSITITPEDIKGLADCTQYLDVKPALLIWRRPAVEATQGRPATKRQPGVSPQPAQPAANFVTVRLVVQGTHDGFKPIENNEADFDATKAAEKLRQVKQDIPQLAQLVRQQIASGDYSTAVLTEFVDAAMALARA